MKKPLKKSMLGINIKGFMTSPKIFRSFVATFALTLCLIFCGTLYVCAQETESGNAEDIESLEELQDIVLTNLRDYRDTDIDTDTVLYESDVCQVSVTDIHDEMIVVSSTYSGYNYGVINVAENKIVLPFKYKDFYFISDDMMFVSEDVGEGQYQYYKADKDGVLTAVDLGVYGDEIHVTDVCNEMIIVDSTYGERGGYGVINMTENKIVLPFKYRDIYFIPDDMMFVVEDVGEGQYQYYKADKDGVLTAVDPGVYGDGIVEYVDELGYMTLSQYIDVEVIDVEQEWPSNIGSVPRMALLDDSYHVVLDYIVDGVWSGPISFEDNYAIVETGATKYYRGSRTIDNNAKYGVIDRSGRWILPPIYRSIDYLGNNQFQVTFDGENNSILSSDSYQPHPSAWAEDDVESAVEYGLVPVSLQYEYTNPMTRADFCALAVALYEKMTGKEIEERTKFSDTCRISVEKAAAVGIVNGIGNGRFAPDAQLTREQAAVILVRLADALDYNLDGESESAAFADAADVSSWAVSGVNQIQSSGIMIGIGDNTFAPKHSYTKEQSIATILRMYELVSSAEQ